MYTGSEYMRPQPALTLLLLAHRANSLSPQPQPPRAESREQRTKISPNLSLFSLPTKIQYRALAHLQKYSVPHTTHDTVTVQKEREPRKYSRLAYA